MLGVMVPHMRTREQTGQASLGLQRKKRKLTGSFGLMSPTEETTMVQEETQETCCWPRYTSNNTGCGKSSNCSNSHTIISGAPNRSSSSRANGIGADLLAEVFSRLPFEERLRTVPLVCKAWRSASCDPACWRSVDMEGWFAKRVEEDYWWEFECEPRVEFLVKKIVDRSCGQLRELRTMHCSDGAIEYIADRCPLLAVLSIRNSPLVTDKSASKLAAGCPEIRELDVSDCYNISNQALESLRRWKPCKLQIKPLVLYFFWQHMLRIYMSSCKLQS